MALCYRHTQHSPFMAGVLAIAGVILVIGLAVGFRPSSVGFTAVLIAVLCVTALAAWYFSSMTIEVTDEELRWHFGPGGRFKIARAKIESAQAVRHPWWGGYGIRSRGLNRWIFIIAGHDCVEVRLRGGGWRRLGTDDPQALVAALGSRAQ